MKKRIKNFCSLYWKIWKEALAVYATVAAVAVGIAVWRDFEDTLLNEWLRTMHVFTLAFFVSVSLAAILISKLPQKKGAKSSNRTIEKQ